MAPRAPQQHQLSLCTNSSCLLKRSAKLACTEKHRDQVLTIELVRPLTTQIDTRCQHARPEHKQQERYNYYRRHHRKLLEASIEHSSTTSPIGARFIPH